MIFYICVLIAKLPIMNYRSLTGGGGGGINWGNHKEHVGGGGTDGGNLKMFILLSI